MRLSEALTICRKPFPAGARKFGVFLACGFTPLHLQSFLTAHLRLGLPDYRIDIQGGLYGDFLGNIARLSECTADWGVIVIEWADLDARFGLRSLAGWRQPDLVEIMDGIRSRLARVRAAIEDAPPNLQLAISLPSLALPPLEVTIPTWRASTFQLELQALISTFAASIAANPAVQVVSPFCLDRVSTPRGRFDVKSELLTGFPYTLMHADALAELLGRLMHRASPKKGLITDLDHTLWKGILGEVGTENVCWDLAGKGHTHGIYQEFLRSLSAMGVLLAVASKNEATLVEDVFARPDLRLSKQCVFPFEVHWDRKSESVARILGVWNIGPESVVFVDDNPAELAEVKAAHPDVECIQYPADVQEVCELLERLRNLFAKPMISNEDRLRLDSVRSNHIVKRETGSNGNNLDVFLEQARSTLSFSFQKDNDPRILDLINKTNQFNLNGNRYTQAALRRFIDDHSAFVLKASYEDRYGPLGKIAAIAGRTNGNFLFIDCWVMSCRAFSRRIEHACLDQLFREFEVETLEFDFRTTDRNEPLRKFFCEFLGAEPASRFRLSRKQFLEKCPQLFHKNEETSHG